MRKKASKMIECGVRNAECGMQTELRRRCFPSPRPSPSGRGSHGWPRSAIRATSPPFRIPHSALRSLITSVVEDEFLRVEQRPEKVSEHLVVFLRFFEEIVQLG